MKFSTRKMCIPGTPTLTCRLYLLKDPIQGFSIVSQGTLLSGGRDILPSCQLGVSPIDLHCRAKVCFRGEGIPRLTLFRFLAFCHQGPDFSLGVIPDGPWPRQVWREVPAQRPAVLHRRNLLYGTRGAPRPFPPLSFPLSAQSIRSFVVCVGLVVFFSRRFSSKINYCCVVVFSFRINSLLLTYWVTLSPNLPSGCVNADSLCGFILIWSSVSVWHSSSIAKRDFHEKNSVLSSSEDPTTILLVEHQKFCIISDLFFSSQTPTTTTYDVHFFVS